MNSIHAGVTGRRISILSPTVKTVASANDGPLYGLILDEKGQRELDRLGQGEGKSDKQAASPRPSPPSGEERETLVLNFLSSLSRRFISKADVWRKLTPRERATFRANRAIKF